MNNTLIEETMLMRQNRADVVAELQRIFPTHGISEATPLSDLAKYMQWAVGLLSIDLATVNVNTDEQEFFTYDEWMSLSGNQKAQRKQCGVRLRANGLGIIIAKSSLGNLTWGPTNIDVDGLKDYDGNGGMLDDYDGPGNTDKIVAAANSTGQAFNAGVKCRQWKCSTLADDGYEDKQQWYLPSVAEMVVINKHIIAINAEMAKYSFTQLSQVEHYTSTEANSVQAWRIALGSGAIYYINYKNNSFTVRPCTRELSSAI